MTINTVNRITSTIRKHIAADNSLTGRGVGVGVDEAAEFGIVVAGLEVIEPGVSISPCPMGPFLRPFRRAFSAPQMGGKFIKFSTHQGHNRLLDLKITGFMRLFATEDSQLPILEFIRCLSLN